MKLFKSSQPRRNSQPATSGAQTKSKASASSSSFLSKHYDAVYASPEEEDDSGPYTPANSTVSRCTDVSALATVPIRFQNPQSALSARIRQVTRGQKNPPGCKRDSGDSELSVRFADQLETGTRRHGRSRVEFKSTASEGDFQDARSSVSFAKTTVSCPPMESVRAPAPKTDKFDYEAYVEYIVKLTGDWTQIQVVHLPNDPAAGLGFGIVGGASTGVVVKTILPGSAADKDQRLRPGDRILQIGRINVQGMSSQQVAGLLRQPEPVIELIVGRPITLTDTPVDTLSCWTMATRAALNPSALEEQIQQRINSMQNGKLRRESHPKTPLTTTAVPMATAATATTNDDGEAVSTEPRPSTSTEKIVDGSEFVLEEGDDDANPAKVTEEQRPHSSGSKDSKSKSGSTERPMSLKNLQETALTVFCRENWPEGQYEEVNVELHRDTNRGLGITVAGYVHKKEEISGVFVKSLVPNSAAHLSNKILVHDLIIDVNGQCLESLSHAESVKALVKSGTRVRLKMIRFAVDSPQAVCLKMLHEQETDTQIVDVQSTLLDYKHYWQNRLGSDYEVLSVIIRPDRNDADGGLGISLEGTVDVVDGTQLCPHHYIESLRKDGPAAKLAVLKAGDELLQVNDQVLYGESHVTVRQALSKAAANAEQKDVRLTLCRRAQQINLYMPSPEQSLPLAYSLLASDGLDRVVKAKSESTLNLCQPRVNYFLQEVTRRLRSRSLEQLSGLAIWNCVPIVVTLEKDGRGLGFSVVDYQDPLRPSESVIVVRSLVPGGVAQADGRIVPGDRLLFVNSTDLSNASVDRAVAVLKDAPPGLVRLGIAKPVPVDQLRFGSHSPIISRSERLLAKGSSPRSHRRRPHFGAGFSGATSQEEVWIGADFYRKLNPQLYFPSSGSASPTTPRSHSSMLTWSPCSSRSLSPCGSPILRGSWGYDVTFLPKNLERSIKLMKGSLALGIVVDAEIDKGINGCVVKSICSKKAVGRDGRVQVGDYLVKINTESLRNVTNAQAKAILKRTNLIGTQCNVTYITAADARLWKQRFHREGESEALASPVNRLSPKVFPKFYRSPILGERPPKRPTGALSVESSFDEDEPMSSISRNTETCVDPHSSAFAFVNEEAVVAAAERIGRAKADEIIDDVLIDKMITDLVQSAFADSYLELVVAASTADWHDGLFRRASTSAETATATLPNSAIPQRRRRPSDSLDSSTTAKLDLSNAHNAAATETPKMSTTNAPTTTVASMVGGVVPAATDTASSSQTASTSEPKAKKKANFWGEARTVLLDRQPNETFGISIVGGRVEVSQKGGLPGTGNTVTGIFIKSVLPESPAGRSGKMFMGDRVVSVNDVDLKDATHEYAVQVIKGASNPVKFVVQSLQSFSHQQQQQQQQQPPSTPSTTLAPTTAPTAIEVGTPSTSASPLETPKEKPKREEEEKRVRMADDEVPVHKIVSEQTSSSSTVSKCSSMRSRRLSRLRESMRKKLDGNSAAALPKHDQDTEEEDRFCYTKDKIKRKYGDLPGEPLLIRLENIPPKGLGLSLAGNRDREKNSVFVVDVKSTSPLPLRIGDELLEINGKVLFGLSHVTATTKIRECCEGDELALLILRRPDALQDIATASAVPASSTAAPPVPPDADNLESEEAPSPSTSAPSPVGVPKSEAAESGPTQPEHETAIAVVAAIDAAVTTTAASTSELARPAVATLSSPAAPPPTSSECAAGVRKKSYQMERTTPIETGKETLIEIDKDGKGLGLSIVGGSDTVLGTVVIHEVYSDGAAAVDGRLKPGDQVLEVNGFSLRSVSHEQAISVLRRTPAKVRLLVYRDVNLQLSLLDPTQIYNIFALELTKKPGRGLGISIVGRKNEPGVYVSEIVKGGVAETDGRLMQGDQILAVNGTDVTSSMQEDVATMLKTCTGRVALKIGRWKLTETANRVHAAQPPSVSPLALHHHAHNNNNNNGTSDTTTTTTTTTMMAAGVGGGGATSVVVVGGMGGPTPTTPRGNGDELATLSNGPENGLREERKDVPPPAPPSWPAGRMPEVTIQDENQVLVHADLSPVTEEPSSQNDLKSLSEVEQPAPPPTPTPLAEVVLNAEWHEEGSDSVLIPLKKAEGQQWGMGIGKRARGILITSLQPGSTAAEKLKVGDRIMGVNGEKVTDQHSAVTLVKASGNCVVLQVARPQNRPTSGNI